MGPARTQAHARRIRLHGGDAMTTIPANLPPLDDELHEQRVLEAARRERLNRPRHLVALSIVLLLIASGFVVYAWTQRAAAFEELATQRTQADLVVGVATKLKALEAKAAAEGRPKWGAPITEIRSKIQQAATLAGLKSAGTLLPQEQTDQLDRKLGVQRKKLTYREVRDESLENLLRWVQSTAAEIPGLEVYALDILQPEPNQWKITVVFSRWERIGG